MSLVTRYGGLFLLIASIVVALALLIDAFTGAGTKAVAVNYCLAEGYSYDERLTYDGVPHGYCVFDFRDCSRVSSCESGINCLQAVGTSFSAFSECPVVDYYNGLCSPCDYPVLDCSSFDGVDFCVQDARPVCAKVRTGITTPYTIRERSWGNACSACFNSKETELVISFTNRSC